MAASPETLREWISQAESNLARLSTEADEIQRRIAQERVQLGLMYELLASLTGEPIPEHPEAPGKATPVRERVVDAVIEILHDHGRPLRIEDIHSEFLRRRLPLPGKGTPTNIAAHLVDRELFTRPHRGMFGLAEWNQRDRSAEPDAQPAESREEVR